VKPTSTNVRESIAAAPAAAALRDGRSVMIRPIRRDDVAHITEFLDALSPPSKHFLFLGGIARLSDAALAHLCAPDAAHDMAYVAVTPGAQGERLTGICRYAAANAEGAEISVAVADDWQHAGLGTRLLETLIAHARTHDVPRLYSMDAANNSRMRHLARQLGFRESPDPDDIHQVIYTLELHR
jgi:GNAT superfamily N-acetyltransferase